MIAAPVRADGEGQEWRRRKTAKGGGGGGLAEKERKEKEGGVKDKLPKEVVVENFNI